MTNAEVKRRAAARPPRGSRPASPSATSSTSTSTRSARIRCSRARRRSSSRKKIRAGDQDALQELVKRNLRFVISVAKKYQNRGLPLIDLIGEGNVGLLTAARKFDPDQGVKFISYAVWWIRQAILSSLARQGRTVRVPLNRTADLSRIIKASEILRQKLRREPTPEELVAAHRPLGRRRAVARRAQHRRRAPRCADGSGRRSLAHRALRRRRDARHRRGSDEPLPHRRDRAGALARCRRATPRCCASTSGSRADASTRSRRSARCSASPASACASCATARSSACAKAMWAARSAASPRKRRIASEQLSTSSGRARQPTVAAFHARASDRSARRVCARPLAHSCCRAQSPELAGVSQLRRSRHDPAQRTSTRRSARSTCSRASPSRSPRARRWSSSATRAPESRSRSSTSSACSSPMRARSGSTASKCRQLSRRELYALRARIGYVFQFAALFDSLTIGENVAMGLRKQGELSEREIATRVRRGARPRRPARTSQERYARRTLGRHAQARRHRARHRAAPQVHPLRRADHGTRSGDQRRHRRSSWCACASSSASRAS